jgi:hypothetical protein
VNAPQNFEHVGRRGFYRPVAVVTFEQGLALCSAAMKHARELELADLLLNSCGLTGFAAPNVFERYDFASMWAQSAGGSLRVALVCRPEILDPERIAVLMAQNRGVSGDVFLTEVAALEWLNSGRGFAAPTG